MFPPPGWKTVTAVLVRRDVGGGDGYGNDVHTAVEIPLAGCITWPRESVENGNQVISGMWLVGPATPPVDVDDAVRVGEVTYEVEGTPGQYNAPFGSVELQQVALRRVTG